VCGECPAPSPCLCVFPRMDEDLDNELLALTRQVPKKEKRKKPR
jgi:hypothetical protein